VEDLADAFIGHEKKNKLLQHTFSKLTIAIDDIESENYNMQGQIDKNEH